MKKLLLMIAFMAMTMISFGQYQGQTDDCSETSTTDFKAESFTLFAKSYSFVLFSYPEKGCGTLNFDFGPETTFKIDETTQTAVLEGSAINSGGDCNYPEYSWDIHFTMKEVDGQPQEPYFDDPSQFRFWDLVEGQAYIRNRTTGDEIQFVNSMGTTIQTGVGANGKNEGQLGGSGWIQGKSGGFTGVGDFNFNLIPISKPVCVPKFTTYQGESWGQIGHKANNYLNANFAKAFPSGLQIGCTRTITLTSAQAVTNFLPSYYGDWVLYGSYVNPTFDLGRLSHHLTALTLAVGFDKYDPNFGESPTALEDQVIASGTFRDWTVKQLMEESNKKLGGCYSPYSAYTLAYALYCVICDYIDGQRTGYYTKCPPKPECKKFVCDFMVWPNPVNNVLYLKSQANKSVDGVTLVIKDAYGNAVCRWSNLVIDANGYLTPIYGMNYYLWGGYTYYAVVVLPDGTTCTVRFVKAYC